MSDPIRVTVWNEFRHEKRNPDVRRIYPDGIHGALAPPLTRLGLSVRTATLDAPEHGLTEAVVDSTDVLVWWGHIAHDEVSEAVVYRVHQRILAGMGLVALHSAHFSKLFRRLMGTPYTVDWRDDGETERIWTIAREHPIAQGIGPSFTIEKEEMYGEPFGVPEPEDIVFISWFAGGEVFRSGLCYRRGFGRIFYFRPGHETFPTYHNSDVQRVIANACKWAAPDIKVVAPTINRRILAPG
ncbi:MAG: ThuA domain-containing protein [Hyphomicrobiales bacterium]|nr:ThuA domain-containing protein [Hyphomicrobiales bacterium]